MKRIINNLTPQKQQYEIIKNKILTLKNWTRAFHRSSLLPAALYTFLCIIQTLDRQNYSFILIPPFTTKPSTGA